MAPTSRSRDSEPYFLLVHTGIAPLTLMKLKFMLAEDSALSFQRLCCCISIVVTCPFYLRTCDNFVFPCVGQHVVINLSSTIVEGSSALLTHNMNISWENWIFFALIEAKYLRKDGNQRLENITKYSDNNGYHNMFVLGEAQNSQFERAKLLRTKMSISCIKNWTNYYFFFFFFFLQPELPALLCAL